MNIPLLPNHQISAGQLQAALNVVVQSAHCIRILDKEDQGYTEGQVALENTLVKACERLDSLLADTSRWALPEMDAQSVASGYAIQHVKLTASQNAIAEAQLLGLNNPPLPGAKKRKDKGN